MESTSAQIRLRFHSVCRGIKLAYGLLIKRNIRLQFAHEILPVKHSQAMPDRFVSDSVSASFCFYFYYLRFCRWMIVA